VRSLIPGPECLRRDVRAGLQGWERLAGGRRFGFGRRRPPSELAGLFDGLGNLGPLTPVEHYPELPISVPRSMAGRHRGAPDSAPELG